MKCQFVSDRSPLGDSRFTVSASSKGVAALCESLINDANTTSFRIFIPRDDVLLGDWMTLWMTGDDKQPTCTVNVRLDYEVIVRLLQSDDSWATKVELLKCCFVTTSDFKRKLTSRYS
jgi:hypothetical protein